MDENMKRRLTYNNLVTDGNKVWLWDIYFNALFCCNKGESIAERLTPFCNNKNNLGMQYSKILKYKKNIIAVPALADNILLYDTETRETRYIAFEADKISAKYGKFWDVIGVGKFAFLIGYYSSCVLKFNMETGRVEKCVQLCSQENSGSVLFKFGFLEEDVILIPSCTDRVVYELNIYSMEYKKNVLDNSANGFNAICKAADDYWLLPRYDGPVVKWNRRKGTIQYYPVEVKDFDFSLSPGLGFLQYDGSCLWAFPLKANKIIKIDINLGYMEEEKDINSYFEYLDMPGDIQKYSYVKIQKDMLYVHTWVSRELICYNTSSGELAAYAYYISNRDYRKYIWESNWEKTMGEDAEFKLCDFIDVLTEDDENRSGMKIIDCEGDR